MRENNKFSKNQWRINDLLSIVNKREVLLIKSFENTKVLFTNTSKSN